MYKIFTYLLKRNLHLPAKILTCGIFFLLMLYRTIAENILEVVVSKLFKSWDFPDSPALKTLFPR